jgi:hypothetical protein
MWVLGSEMAHNFQGLLHYLGNVLAEESAQGKSLIIIDTIAWYIFSGLTMLLNIFFSSVFFSPKLLIHLAMLSAVYKINNDLILCYSSQINYLLHE